MRTFGGSLVVAAIVSVAVAFTRGVSGVIYFRFPDQPLLCAVLGLVLPILMLGGGISLLLPRRRDQ